MANEGIQKGSEGTSGKGGWRRWDEEAGRQRGEEERERYNWLMGRKKRKLDCPFT